MSSDWVTVQAAARIIGRDVSRLYAWVREDRIRSAETADGRILVRIADARELEAVMTRRRNNKTRR